MGYRWRHKTAIFSVGEKRGVMRGIVCVVGVAALALVLAVPVAAFAQTPTYAQTHPKKKPAPVELRSASGTVIQPTRTIIHNPDGTTTIIVVPRRSYLDVGMRSRWAIPEPMTTLSRQAAIRGGLIGISDPIPRGLAAHRLRSRG